MPVIFNFLHQLASSCRPFGRSIMWVVGLLMQGGILLAQPSEPLLVPMEFSVEHFTPAEGLASGKVISLAQDSIGYLWFGTQEGLYRYDGYTLRLYQHDPTDSSSLSNNTAEVIHIDQAGSLWVGTQPVYPPDPPARGGGTAAKQRAKCLGSGLCGRLQRPQLLQPGLCGGVWVPAE
jgi:hypothetical protein